MTVNDETLIEDTSLSTSAPYTIHSKTIPNGEVWYVGHWIGYYEDNSSDSSGSYSHKVFIEWPSGKTRDIARNSDESTNSVKVNISIGRYITGDGSLQLKYEISEAEGTLQHVSSHAAIRRVL